MSKEGDCELCKAVEEAGGHVKKSKELGIPQTTQNKETDIFRDTPIRYLGLSWLWTLPMQCEIMYLPIIAHLVENVYFLS